MATGTVRITRGDLARFPAHVYIIPTSGDLTGKGAAVEMLNGLSAHPCFEGEGQDFLQQAKAQFKGGQLEPGRAQQLEPLRGSRPNAPTIICTATSPFGYVRVRDGQKLVRAALTSALRIVDEIALRTKGEFLTVAMPALGSGAAGLTGAGAAAAVLDVLEQWTKQSAHEAVVVLWSPRSFRDFLQEHRARVTPKPAGLLHGSSPHLQELLPPLVERLAEPSSVLFVGSGLSCNADPPLPSWTELLKPFLGPEFDEHSDKHRELLPDFAQIMADGRSKARRKMERHIAETLRAPSLPSLCHFQLLSLPWSAIVTTNYDTLIEDTLRALNLPYTLVTRDQELVAIADPEKRGVPVVKVHGGLNEEGELSKGRKGEPRMVVTRDDYDRFFEHHPALGAYVETQLLTSRGVIVGYSISDAHLRQMFARIGGLSQVQRTRKPHLLAIMPEPSIIEPYWQHRGMATVPVPLGSFRDFIDATTTLAHRRMSEAQIPPDRPSRQTWQTLASGLEPQPFATLLAAIVGAGGKAPSRKLLAKATKGGAKQAVLELARLHMSPERFSWLEEDLEDDE